MNNRAQGREGVAGPDSARSCCVHEAALEVLAVPVGITNLDSLLYANREMRQLLGLSAGAGAGGYPISVLVDSDHSEALRERRRTLLERGIAVRNSPVKLNTLEGYGLNMGVDTEPISFGSGEQALVQLFRSINGIKTLSYSAAILSAEEAARTTDTPCLHAAAFEALPMPGAILESQRVVSANRQSRLILGEDWAEGDLTLARLLHPDFLDTGKQLFGLALHNLHATHGCRAKMLSPEGTALYATLDAIPVQCADARYAAVFALEVGGAEAR